MGAAIFTKQGNRDAGAQVTELGPGRSGTPRYGLPPSLNARLGTWQRVPALWRKHRGERLIFWRPLMPPGVTKTLQTHPPARVKNRLRRAIRS